MQASSASLTPLSVQSNAWDRFFQSEARGGVLLFACTLAALVWANSPWSGSYFDLLHSTFGFSWNDSRFMLSWDHWINDGLMAVFFFVVGLEIKREIVVGELSSMRKAVLPVAAAIGGMVVPVLIYSGLNHGTAGEQGWGVPMATDIAFALGALALLGPRVPAGLKVLLAALAIVDDLGAVLVIAIFYTDRILVAPLVMGGICLALMVLAEHMRVNSIAVYAVLVIGVWLGILESGIHATIAGVLVAMVVPVRSRIRSRRFFELVRVHIAELESKTAAELRTLNSDQIEVLEKLHQATNDVVPKGLAFERTLHPLTAYLILPLFALFNAGIVLSDKAQDAVFNNIGLGVLLGLMVGKPIGILAGTWLATRLRLAELPAGVTWLHIFGTGIFAGIGFTMALFVADLAIPDPRLLAFAKVGVLIPSVICGLAGYLVLKKALERAPEERMI